MFKIALRNVFRNRRRTLLSLLLIALGTASLFVFKGYFDFVYWRTGQDAVAIYGHLQIADARLWDASSGGYEYLIDPGKLDRIKAILLQDPDLQNMTVRLTLSGIVGTERKSSVFLATGVEPESEVASTSSI